jgi:hypothetical protein
MNKSNQQKIVEEIVESLRIPNSAYDKAEARYKSLGKWFGRSESKCSKHDPHIYPQGSFRLGTVVRGDEYDLDFGCRLRKGVTKDSHTQKDLKDLVGDDMKTYRDANNMEHELKEKHRCWRQGYADELSFHMDGVPSIPEHDDGRRLLKEAMVKAGRTTQLAEDVAALTGAITDNRLTNYDRIAPDWRVSNSEGYALWFESRMRKGMSSDQERSFLEKRAMAKVDNLPVQRASTPLQECVQVLKKHRNIMFARNEDSKPISVILTTLAAWAYNGEVDTSSALRAILSKMGSYVRNDTPRVPNPVNPAEDFADKWYDPKYAHLDLENSFGQWLEQAQQDFELILSSSDPDFIAEQVDECFGAKVDVQRLKAGICSEYPPRIHIPKKHKVSATPAKPWCL